MMHLCNYAAQRSSGSEATARSSDERSVSGRNDGERSSITRPDTLVVYWAMSMLSCGL